MVSAMKKMKRAAAFLAASVLALSLTAAAASAASAAADESSLLGITAAEQEVYDFATQVMGLNAAAACGIMGNARNENSFGVGWDDDGDYFGLFQWNGDSVSRMNAYCASAGYDMNTISGQMHFMYHELSEEYPSVLELLRNSANSASGAWDAGYHFSTDYEQPSNDAFSRTCGDAAAAYFPQIISAGTNSTGSTASTDSGNAGSTGSTDSGDAGSTGSTDSTIVSGAPAAERLAGTDTYETAAAIARTAFPQGASDVILVSGEVYADALTASGLAGAEKIPLLITQADHLSEATADLIKQWQVKNVTIIGGESAVSKQTEEELFAAGISNAERIWGEDRYGTSKEVFTANKDLFISNEKNACIIASGKTAADALSISPWSYAFGMPIFLTDGQHLDLELAEAANSFAETFVLGGTAAVGTEVRNIFTNSVKTFAGDDRFDTSVKIAETFVPDEGGVYQNTGFTSGDDACFAVTLAACPLLGKLKAPVVLTDGASSFVRSFVSGKMVPDTSVTQLYILGDENAVSARTADELRRLWMVCCEG